MEDRFKTPGQLLSYLVDEKGWSKRVLAAVIGMSETVVNKMTNDVRPISAEESLLLEEVFGVPAERFLRLQADYNLAKAKITSFPDAKRSLRADLFSKLPISEMVKRGWLEIPNIKEFDLVESEIQRFFGVSSPDEIPVFPHANKKTEVTAETTSVQLAWLYRVRQLALEIVAPPATKASIERAIDEISPLRISETSIRKIPNILLKSGIRFVIVEGLPSTKIDGVCFWLTDSAPVIALSMRFDRIDNFWFVLSHELEHARRGHGKKIVNIDSDMESSSSSDDETLEEEKVANEAAANFCVPTKKIDSFIARKSPLISERDLLGFSKIHKIHPGLAVGQIHAKTGRYQLFRKHLVNVSPYIFPASIVDGWGSVALTEK